MKQFLGKTEQQCHEVKCSMLSLKTLKQLSLEPISEKVLCQDPACVAPIIASLELLKIDYGGYTTKYGNIRVQSAGHLFPTLHHSQSHYAGKTMSIKY